MRKTLPLSLFTIASALPLLTVPSVYAQSTFTDSDNNLIGTITEDQVLQYGLWLVIGLVLLTLAIAFIKKKNAPHIKTDLKEMS